MRILALLGITLVLGCVFSGAKEALDIPAVEDEVVRKRDLLVNRLSFEVSQFIKEGKIPDRHRLTAKSVLNSLLYDPPLKTEKELEEVKGRDFGKLNGQQIQESVAEGLAGLSPAYVPVELAYDIMRLSILGGILQRNGLKSKALDDLTWKAMLLAWSAKEL